MSGKLVVLQEESLDYGQSERQPIRNSKSRGGRRAMGSSIKKNLLVEDSLLGTSIERSEFRPHDFSQDQSVVGPLQISKTLESRRNSKSRNYKIRVPESVKADFGKVGGKSQLPSSRNFKNIDFVKRNKKKTQVVIGPGSLTPLDSQPGNQPEYKLTLPKSSLRAATTLRERNPEVLKPIRVDLKPESALGKTI